jgi:hypothetical protein
VVAGTRAVAEAIGGLVTARTARIRYEALADIEPAQRNPKAHDVDAIRASIRRAGFVAPLIVNDRTGELLEGHGRLEALQAMQAAGEEPPDGIRASKAGWKAPVLGGVDLSPEDAAAYLVAANRTVELGGWDEAALAALLGEFRTEDDLEGTGYDPAELDALIASIGGPEPDPRADDVPEPASDPYVQRGELYALGGHRLLCGDATSAEDVERLLAGEQAGAIVTDPPYYVGKPIANDDLAGKRAVAFTAAWLAVLPPAHTMIAFQSPQTVTIVLDAARAAGWRFGRMLWMWKPWAAFTVVPWHGWSRRSEAIVVFERGAKWPEWVPYHADLYEWATRDEAVEPASATDEQLHPTLKPVEVVADLIAHTTGDLYDPFLGSGTTLIAAERLGRRCYGIEIEPRYAQVAIERWEAFTGGKAERLDAS